MGSPEEEKGRYEREGPQHEVKVAEFYLSRYAVTNEQYGRYLKAHPKATKPAYWGDRSRSACRGNGRPGLRDRGDYLGFRPAR